MMAEKGECKSERHSSVLSTDEEGVKVWVGKRISTRSIERLLALYRWAG
jgi:hypothetical protein